MAETLWKWRLFIFANTVANTQANRDALAQVFVDSGAGESLANEKLMFTNAVRLALPASPSVLAAHGVSFPVKASMRDNLQTAIATINAPLSNANKVRWYLVAAIDWTTFQAGDLIASNRSTVDGLVGTPFTFADALTDLGLVAITE
jgi:hypothetical protein